MKPIEVKLEVDDVVIVIKGRNMEVWEKNHIVW